MKVVVIILFCLALKTFVFGQIVNTATMDSSDYVVKGKVTIEGYIDSYFAYNLKLSHWEKTFPTLFQCPGIVKLV